MNSQKRSLTDSNIDSNSISTKFISSYGKKRHLLLFEISLPLEHNEFRITTGNTKCICKSKEFVQRIDMTMARCLYDCCIPINVVNSLYFQSMIDAIADIGRGYAFQKKKLLHMKSKFSCYYLMIVKIHGQKLVAQ